MSVIYGIVKQNMIQLPEGIELHDGDQVEIRIRSTKRTSTKRQQAETLFKQRLLQLGVLSHLPTPSASTRAEIDLVVIPGQPLSEQIIAERR
jgi:hypothetical protein